MPIGRIEKNTMREDNPGEQSDDNPSKRKQNEDTFKSNTVLPATRQHPETETTTPTTETFHKLSATK